MLTLYSFCRALRATYRKPQDKSHEQVVDAHGHFARTGRALAEVTEYFGQIMTRKQTVFHGIDRIMYFSSFTEYFNAPTSTTISQDVGTYVAS